jgi:hypothetical protein
MLAVAHKGDISLHMMLDLLLFAVHRLEDVVELSKEGGGR